MTEHSHPVGRGCSVGCPAHGMPPTPPAPPPTGMGSPSRGPLPFAETDVPAYRPIADHFCGQQQPHAAHTWETPPAYGTATFIVTYQCGGFTAYVTPPAEPEAGR